MHSEEVSFKLKFDTPEEDGKPTHQIDAETLADSLKELSGLLRNSLKTLNGESASAHLDVKANSEGSFIVEFVAFLSAGGLEMLKTLGITAATTATTGGSVFSLLKQIGERKIVKRIINDDDSVSLVLSDDKKIDCTQEVSKLMDSYSVLKNIENLVSKPITHGGANGISFLDENEIVITSLPKEALNSFKAPTRKDFTSEKTSVDRFEVVFEVINFTKPTGWKIRIEGEDSQLSVRINDQAFLERVSASKRDFKKGQTFLVDLKKKEKLIEGLTTVAYSIEHVD